MRLVFATNNAHKLEEARAILGDRHEVVSLRDIDCYSDIPETADTLEGNSSQKAWYIWEHYHLCCFADDTGLEVDALHGEPGVKTARYAGEQHDDVLNRQKLLRELQGKQSRTARFRTVVTLIIDGEQQQFEGVVNGSIAETESGSCGFGYDPLFVPQEYGVTFASLLPEEKNKISHRGRALKKMEAALADMR